LHVRSEFRFKHKKIEKLRGFNAIICFKYHKCLMLKVT
jgi:hypothetical protein